MLVSGSVFKTDGAPRKRALGGFDSRALPLVSLAFGSCVQVDVARSKAASQESSFAPKAFCVDDCIQGLRIGSFACGRLQVDGGAAAPPLDLK